MAAKLKRKIYRTVVRPAMMYSIKIVSLSNTQKAEFEVEEMKKLRSSLGMTKMDKV